MILERFKVPKKDQVLVSEAALRRTVTEIFEMRATARDGAIQSEAGEASSRQLPFDWRSSTRRDGRRG